MVIDAIIRSVSVLMLLIIQRKRMLLDKRKHVHG